MNFPKVMSALQAQFQDRNIDFALVGGLAIHAMGISRSTRDIDLLTLLSDAGQIDQVMKALGYDVLQRTDDIASYLSKDWEMGRVDVLFARRKYAKAMIQRAKGIPLFGNEVKVLLPEDMIGLKVQSSSNDPERTHKDMADIETLMRLHGKSLDWDLVREYFKLFDRE
jgi:predicted nucleotidyltransferase